MSSSLRFFLDNAPWLAAGALLAFLSSFGQTFFLAVFSGDIRAAFGLSHGGWGTVYMIGTGLSAALVVWAGGLADRFRVRVLGSLVVAGLGLSCLAMAAAPSVAVLVLVVLALRFFGQGMAMHVSVVAMARWFAANRGKALATATAGFAIAEATMPLGFVALKRVAEWRMLFVAVGIACFVAIPLLFLLLRTERTPQGEAEMQAAAGMGGRHWTRGEVLRHPLFVALVPAMIVTPAFATAFWFHQMHFAEIKGWVHLSLVAVFPLGTAAFVTSTVFYGWAIDRWGSGPLLPLFLLPMSLAFAVHAASAAIWHEAVAVVLMGLSGGGQATLLAACWAEFFGTRHMGSVKAGVAAIMVFGSAVGPSLTGLLIDLGIELPMQYAVCSLVFAGCAVILVPATRAARAALTAPA